MQKLKIVISIILIFDIMFFNNIFCSNCAVYAGDATSSLGDLNAYSGRNWRKFAKAKD